MRKPSRFQHSHGLSGTGSEMVSAMKNSVRRMILQPTHFASGMAGFRQVLCAGFAVNLKLSH